MRLLDAIARLPAHVVHHWGYWVLFLAALLEPLPGFGLFIPGQTLAVVAGFLARLHVLHPFAAWAVASLGAILGDLGGYLLGQRYGAGIVAFGKRFGYTQARHERTRRLLKEHAGKTILVGRFSSLTRSFVPFVAGTMRVPPGRFLLFNVLGGVSWAATYVALGYLFGAGYQAAARWLGAVFLGALLLGVLIILGYRRLARHLRRALRHPGPLLAVNVLALYAFGKLAEDVLDAEAITRLDLRVHDAVATLWQPGLTLAAKAASALASPAVLGTLSVLLVAALLLLRRRRDALLAAATLLGGFALEISVKALVGRARPTAALVAARTASFPSGHATMALLFSGLLVALFAGRFRAGWRRALFVAGNALVVLLVGCSRAYLGVHWLSDVLAGYALGLFWLTLLLLGFRLAESLRPRQARDPRASGTASTRRTTRSPGSGRP